MINITGGLQVDPAITLKMSANEKFNYQFKKRLNRKLSAIGRLKRIRKKFIYKTGGDGLFLSLNLKQLELSKKNLGSKATQNLLYLLNNILFFHCYSFTYFLIIF